MSKGINNILVSIILLIFVGQVIASTSVSCEMSDRTDMYAMNHDMSSMEASQDSSLMDCCSDSNHCNMGSCSVLALTNITPIKITNFSSNKTFFEIALAPTQTLSSLYRPPILA